MDGTLSLCRTGAELMREASYHAQKQLRQWMKDDAVEIASMEAPSKAPIDRIKDTSDETLNSTWAEGQQTQQQCSQEINGMDPGGLASRVLNKNFSVVETAPQDPPAETIGIFQQDVPSPPTRTPAGQ